MSYGKCKKRKRTLLLFNEIQLKMNIIVKIDIYKFLVSYLFFSQITLEVALTIFIGERDFYFIKYLFCIFFTEDIFKLKQNDCFFRDVVVIFAFCFAWHLYCI